MDILCSSDRKTFCVVHCTGYLKSWSPAKVALEDDEGDATDTGNLSCLVAIGKLLPPYKQQSIPESNHIQLRPMEFMSRHSVDGKFTYIDQRLDNSHKIWVSRGGGGGA